MLAAYWLLERPEKPIHYRGQHQADVPRFFQSIFQLLRPGAVVHLAHEGSARRLRLRKIYLEGKRHGVRLELPNFAGADHYLERLRNDLATAGFHGRCPDRLILSGPLRTRPSLWWTG